MVLKACSGRLNASPTEVQPEATTDAVDRLRAVSKGGKRRANFVCATLALCAEAIDSPFSRGGKK